MRKIAIRIDDIAEDMDWEKFEKFERILTKYEIAPLIGVIPKNMDSMIAKGNKKQDFSEWLKQKKEAGWCIAMHGYEHCYKTKKKGVFPLNPFSEFAGVSYKEQYRKISDGKKQLQKLGVETDIFMAPGHSFDHNTVKALKKCGFRYITDGFGNAPYVRENMTYLPIAFQRSREFKKKDGYTTFVVHTATMKEGDFLSYEKMIEEKREYFVSYFEMINAKAKNQSPVARLLEYSMAWMKGLLCRIRG